MTNGRLAALRSRVRIAKFVSVGLVGALCDTAVLLLLSEGFGVIPELATLAGIETAILVMFTVNDRWTFADEGGAGWRSVLRRLGRSHLVRAAGSATQFVVFVFVYRILFIPLTVADIPLLGAPIGAGGGAGLATVDLWLLVAKTAGIGIGMLVNYVCESVFTWRVSRADAVPEEHNP